MSKKCIKHILLVVLIFIFNLNANAQSDYFRKTCRLVSTEYSEMSWYISTLIHQYHQEKNPILKKEKIANLKDFVEKLTDKQFRIRQSMEKDIPELGPKYSLYISMTKWAFEYGIDLASSKYGNSQDYFERNLYDDCAVIGRKADAIDNESNLRRQEIENILSSLRIRQAEIKAAMQSQTIINNPIQPRFCTTSPDGPGSSRMITTCF